MWCDAYIMIFFLCQNTCYVVSLLQNNLFVSVSPGPLWHALIALSRVTPSTHFYVSPCLFPCDKQGEYIIKHITNGGQIAVADYRLRSMTYYSAESSGLI